eukprot:TRINITY_DN9598_c0_g1_i1.p1 TRINITY_DN9598_c0_g1~~TRINITY_DN9598_c0_g1_i1.p1  ORF type:complete len:349 (+),score=57.10 TRINITY_DN9598_c0_g1_i1:47-1093(+)
MKILFNFMEEYNLKLYFSDGNTLELTLTGEDTLESVAKHEKFPTELSSSKLKFSLALARDPKQSYTFKEQQKLKLNASNFLPREELLVLKVLSIDGEDFSSGIPRGLLAMYGYPYVPSIAHLVNVPNLLGNQEFGFSETFHPKFIDAVCCFGYFPMAIAIMNDKYAMAIKCHRKRCIVTLGNFKISKSTRRRAKNYSITANHAFEKSVNLCVDRHGDNWLCKPLRKAFIHMFFDRKQYKTQLHSFEVWRDDEIVAVELGYSVGSIYTSLTGAYTESNCGMVQLYCTGKVLQKLGFKIWDFGMAMEYKMDLGASLVPREEWLKKVASLKDIDLQLIQSRINARELLTQP